MFNAKLFLLIILIFMWQCYFNIKLQWGRTHIMSESFKILSVFSFHVSSRFLINDGENELSTIYKQRTWHNAFYLQSDEFSLSVYLFYIFSDLDWMLVLRIFFDIFLGV